MGPVTLLDINNKCLLAIIEDITLKSINKSKRKTEEVVNIYQGGTGMSQQTYDYKQVRRKCQLNVSLKCNSRPGYLNTHENKTHG